MRAWSEFSYLKGNIKIEEKEFAKREIVSTGTMQAVREFSDELSKIGIQHRVLDIQNNLITIIVKDLSLSQFRKYIKSIGYKKINHPLGEENGYTFLYQMAPFTLYRKNGLYVEVYSQLPCASLTPKTWIPLDRFIQKRVWDYDEKKDGIIWCDLICEYIYHLCWAIFVHKGFSPYEKDFLTRHKNVLVLNELKKALICVFFNFTDKLIALLDKEEYDIIVKEYCTFSEY